MSSQQRSIRFPQELHDRIVAEAKRTDRSFAYVVLKACEARFAEWSDPKVQESIREVARGVPIPEVRTLEPFEAVVDPGAEESPSVVKTEPVSIRRANVGGKRSFTPRPKGKP